MLFLSIFLLIWATFIVQLKADTRGVGSRISEQKEAKSVF